MAFSEALQQEQERSSRRRHPLTNGQKFCFCSVPERDRKTSMFLCLLSVKTNVWSCLDL